jgi:hypothetical protein
VRLRRALGALGLYCGAVAVLGRAVWVNLDTSIIGPSDFDNFYYAWSVSEFKGALLAGRLPGFSHDVYGQAGSIPIFVEGFLDHLLAVPLQWFLSPIGAYNVTVLLGFPLAAFAMYLLASAFTSNWTACFVAGLVFSFSTFHLARAMGHIGLATIEVLPFCAWSLVVFRRGPSARTAILAGIGAGLVSWASVYYVAYFLMPFALLLALAALLTDRRWFADRGNIALLGLVVGVGVLVALPSFIDYPALGPADLAAIRAQASHWELRIYSANLAALFLPDPANPLLGSHVASLYPTIPGVPERAVFLGYPGLILAGLALSLRPRDRVTLAWLAVASVGIGLALGSGLRVGNRYLFPLPFYDAVYGNRVLEDFGAPNRLSVLTLTAVAVLAALGVTAGLSRLPRSRGWQVGTSLAIVGLVFIGLAPNLLFGYGLTAIPVRVPALYRTLASAPDDGLVLEVPQAIGSAQYFQTISHKRLAAGVVPRLPDPAAIQLENVPYYSVLATGWQLPDSDTVPTAAGVDIYPLGGFAQGLRAHGISYFVLHRLNCIDPAALWPCYELPNYEQARRFLADTLGPPFYDAPDGLTAWHVEAPARAPDPGVSYQLGAGWIPYLGRLTDGEPLRVMGPLARVLVQSPTAGEAHLHLRASSFARPMTLEVRFNNGRPLSVSSLPVGRPGDLDLGPVRLRRGMNELELRSRQGCVVPDDLDSRNYRPSASMADYRCVSFAVDRVALQPG